jgi:hypothetical protein
MQLDEFSCRCVQLVPQDFGLAYQDLNSLLIVNRNHLWSVDDAIMQPRKTTPKQNYGNQKVGHDSSHLKEVILDRHAPSALRLQGSVQPSVTLRLHVRRLSTLAADEYALAWARQAMKD